MKEALEADLDRVKAYETIERVIVDGGGIFQDKYYYTLRCDSALSIWVLVNNTHSLLPNICSFQQ